MVLLFGSLSEENGMEHPFFLFPSNPKFSFSPKLGGIGENEIVFNDFFIKTLRMPLIFL